VSDPRVWGEGQPHPVPGGRSRPLVSVDVVVTTEAQSAAENAPEPAHCVRQFRSVPHRGRSQRAEALGRTGIQTGNGAAPQRVRGRYLKRRHARLLPRRSIDMLQERSAGRLPQQQRAFPSCLGHAVASVAVSNRGELSIVPPVVAPAPSARAITGSGLGRPASMPASLAVGCVSGRRFRRWLSTS